MRRMTRRIGMFGGPGAIAKAAGAKPKRGTRMDLPRPSAAETEDASPPPAPPVTSATEPPKPNAAAEKKSWWSRVFGSKE